MLQHIHIDQAFDLPTLYQLARGCAKQFANRHSAMSTGWQEIAYMRCEQPDRWRFMGVSVNVLVDGSYPDEIVSSIFRNDPVEEIACPWDTVFSFCETTLQLSMGRIFPPVVRLMDSTQPDRFCFLRGFNYESMEWDDSIHPLAVLSSAS